ncbi:MAG: hypothetical protein WCA46_26000 [Actinocatenispora sp.]
MLDTRLRLFRADAPVDPYAGALGLARRRHRLVMRCNTGYCPPEHFVPDGESDLASAGAHREPGRRA